MLPRPLTTFAAATLLACATPGYAGPINDRIYPAPRVALTLEGTPAGTAAITVVTRDAFRRRGLSWRRSPVGRHSSFSTVTGRARRR